MDPIIANTFNIIATKNNFSEPTTLSEIEKAVKSGINSQVAEGFLTSPQAAKAYNQFLKAKQGLDENGLYVPVFKEGGKIKIKKFQEPSGPMGSERQNPPAYMNVLKEGTIPRVTVIADNLETTQSKAEATSNESIDKKITPELEKKANFFSNNPYLPGIAYIEVAKASNAVYDLMEKDKQEFVNRQAFTSTLNHVYNLLLSNMPQDIREKYPQLNEVNLNTGKKIFEAAENLFDDLYKQDPSNKNNIYFKEYASFLKNLFPSIDGDTDTSTINTQGLSINPELKLQEQVTEKRNAFKETKNSTSSEQELSEIKLKAIDNFKLLFQFNRGLTIADNTNLGEHHVAMSDFLDIFKANYSEEEQKAIREDLETAKLLYKGAMALDAAAIVTSLAMAPAKPYVAGAGFLKNVAQIGKNQIFHTPTFIGNAGTGLSIAGDLHSNESIVETVLTELGPKGLELLGVPMSSVVSFAKNSEIYKKLSGWSNRKVDVFLTDSKIASIMDKVKGSKALTTVVNSKERLHNWFAKGKHSLTAAYQGSNVLAKHGRTSHKEKSLTTAQNYRRDLESKNSQNILRSGNFDDIYDYITNDYEHINGFEDLMQSLKDVKYSNNLSENIKNISGAGILLITLLQIGVPKPQNSAAQTTAQTSVSGTSLSPSNNVVPGQAPTNKNGGKFQFKPRKGQFGMKLNSYLSSIGQGLKKFGNKTGALLGKLGENVDGADFANLALQTIPTNYRVPTRLMPAPTASPRLIPMNIKMPTSLFMPGERTTSSGTLNTAQAGMRAQAEAQARTEEAKQINQQIAQTQQANLGLYGSDLQKVDAVNAQNISIQSEIDKINAQSKMARDNQIRQNIQAFTNSQIQQKGLAEQQGLQTITQSFQQRFNDQMQQRTSIEPYVKALRQKELELENLNANITAAESKVSELQSIASRTPEQEQELTTLQTEIATAKNTATQYQQVIDNYKSHVDPVLNSYNSLNKEYQEFINLIVNHSAKDKRIRKNSPLGQYFATRQSTSTPATTKKKGGTISYYKEAKETVKKEDGRKHFAEAYKSVNMMKAQMKYLEMVNKNVQKARELTDKIILSIR